MGTPGLISKNRRKPYGVIGNAGKATLRFGFERLPWELSLNRRVIPSTDFASDTPVDTPTGEVYETDETIPTLEGTCMRLKVAHSATQTCSHKVASLL